MTPNQLENLIIKFRRYININPKKGWDVLDENQKKELLKSIGLGEMTVKKADKIHTAFNFSKKKYMEEILKYDGIQFLNEDVDIKKYRSEGYVVIGVHNGIFHCDDVTACACLDILLENLYDYSDKFEVKKVAIVRTRNSEVLKECSICVDVGGGTLDHHTKNVKRENGKLYSSIGLVWKTYGKKMIQLIMPDLSTSEIDRLFEKIDNEIIRHIDADDNGELIEKKPNDNGKIEETNVPDNEKYYIAFDFDFITIFNPSWHEENPDYNGSFIRAFEVTRRTFNNCLKSIILEKKIKDENESISLEEQEQFVKDTAIKYQESLLKNFSKEPNVMKIYEDNEDMMKALSEIKKEQLITAVNENIKLFLEQHSFKYNTEKDKKEILEQKIRQIVDEFYATKIIEVLIQNPNNIKSSCLIIPAQTFPWKKGIFSYNEKHKDNPIRFVMYPYPNGGYAIECVQKSSALDDRYTKITPLLSKVPFKLKKLIEFVHKNRFFARTRKDINEDEAKNALYDLCEKSIEAQSFKRKIYSIKSLFGKKFTSFIHFFTKHPIEITDGETNNSQNTEDYDR